jgi:hypothetical protein
VADASKRQGSALSYVVDWLALLLTGLSVLSAYLGLDAYAAVVQFGIAATQATIIFALLMRLRGAPPLGLRHPPRLADAMMHAFSSWRGDD